MRFSTHILLRGTRSLALELCPFSIKQINKQNEKPKKHEKPEKCTLWNASGQKLWDQSGLSWNQPGGERSRLDTLDSSRYAYSKHFPPPTPQPPPAARPRRWKRVWEKRCYENSPRVRALELPVEPITVGDPSSSGTSTATTATSTRGRRGWGGGEGVAASKKGIRGK